MDPTTTIHEDGRRSDPILHYFYDPLCGWCYASEPLIEIARQIADLRIELHGGGLIPEPVRLPEAKRKQVRVADARIHDLTGQVFGPAYLDDLLDHPDAIWHSPPTIAAVMAAEAIAKDKAFPMIAAIQRAHYVHGRRVVDPDTLAELAQSIGLDESAFRKRYASAFVAEHIEDSRGMMRRFGLHGFPTFLLEISGQFVRLQHEPLYGKPDEFKKLVTLFMTELGLTRSVS
ncbi:DsbA family protein [Methylobacterium sp. Leaf112]|uniref:DsbA family protein n=1 Tax=Methylobacterium sp. Leaf112 TaxID=1736258 RepID=UPI0006FF7A11|nr:DsbA family protein [Methylobacterium sp. Leaf112]KQP60702.1 hypothetical protein ASF52_06085 [Methylobacterium sp. Leaf112]